MPGEDENVLRYGSKRSGQKLLKHGSKRHREEEEEESGPREEQSGENLLKYGSKRLGEEEEEQSGPRDEQSGVNKAGKIRRRKNYGFSTWHHFFADDSQSSESSLLATRIYEIIQFGDLTLAEGVKVALWLETHKSFVPRLFNIMSRNDLVSTMKKILSEQ